MTMYPSNPAPADAPLIDIIKNRWSPYAFSGKAIPADKVAALFEAARWAPSSFNEQPWRYIYALKEDTDRKMIESLLVDGNAWAKDAGLLMISFAKKTFARNGKPNRHCMHDLGCANGFITLQAESMGLVTHQMAGFFVEKANEVLGVPDDYEPGSMMAVGFPGDPKTISEDLQKREQTPRTRNAASSFAMRGRWMAS